MVILAQIVTFFKKTGSMVYGENDFNLFDKETYTYLLSTWFSKLSYAFWRNKYHVFVELSLLLFILSFFFIAKPYKPKKHKPLTHAEKDELIKDWRPQPLVSKSLQKYFAEEVPQLALESASSPIVSMEGQSYHLLCCTNFLGVASHPSIKSTAKEVIGQYAVGSCGPRGFYGTTEHHLALEKRISEFYGCEESVAYADSIGCISSVISAFSKKQDIIVCDKGCNYFIKQGVKISHSKAYFFEHNDLTDLENTLKGIIKEDLRFPRRPIKRRFIVVEGIFQNYGDICQLREVVRLKEKYRFRLILDDSLAVGVLSLRGSLEFWDLGFDDVEIYCGSLNNAFGSVCSFTTGDSKLCEYQRLGSSGYCFSASAPPFTCASAVVAIDIVKREWAERSVRLKENAVFFFGGLGDIADRHGFELSGDERSPVSHLRLGDNREGKSIRQVAKRLQESSVVGELWRVFGQPFAPEESIRFCVTSEHTKESLLFVLSAIEDVCKNI